MKFPFSRRFVRVWQRNRDVFLRLWRSEAPGSIAEPLMVLLAMGMGIGSFIGSLDGQRYIEFLAPGIIASYSMFSASFECTYGSFVRMEFQKTFDAIIATPLSVEDVIAGEIIWGATRSVITAAIILLIAAAFGLIHSFWAVLVLPFAFVAGLLFASIALVYTSAVKSIYNFNYYFTLFITPMYFFSGVFFPLSSLPEVIQKTSWVFPLTSAIYTVRSLASGNLSTSMVFPVSLITVLAVIFFIIALYTMRKRLTV